MFDSKKILDALVQGAAQQGQGGGGLGGGLGGLLGSVLGGVQQQTGRPGAAPQAGAGGLGDLLGGLLGGAQGGQGGNLGNALIKLPGGLGGLLGGLLGGAQQPGQPGAQAQAQPGGIGDILGSLLGQATGGVRDAAQHTGVQGKIADAIEQATGRTLAGSAARLGGLALIAGLAYRAYQNYAAGKDPIQFGSEVSAAPQNSAFHPDAGDADSNALLMLRGMIAAAAADGQIDDAEKKAILGNVQALGMDQNAVKFLNNEVANPADAATLAGEVSGPEQATALYTACLLAIDVNNRAERRFMDDLAEALGLDEQLVKQIEASTEGVKHAA